MNNKMTALLIEDNQAIAKQILSFLEGHGWTVDYASTGKLGIDLAVRLKFDVIILDLNLPDIDGLSVCKAIKQEANINPPILMLTARDSFEDKHKGFSLGADDYLTKPFDLRELVLRCDALSRRTQLHEEHIINRGHLSIDSRAHQATWHGQTIKLTKVGFIILKKLVNDYPYPVSRSDIIEQVWGDEPPESNALKSHIYTLRKSFEKVGMGEVLCTISNIGYQLKDLDD
ncbi:MULTISPECIES: response regulator transcription factor [Thalassotalea]|uniref:response regulator transcription factor n=1 Tax=Thalassotalea TaxID=1518149 RepID=UPI0009432DFB|nr:MULTISPECIES: response regulator transcription factor [Thalassotalea]OKY27347.1 DNA-binding response regulator [Thalassotalea sp. PP2-459]